MCTGNVRYDGMRVAMRVQCSNVLLLLLPAARKNIFFDKKNDIFSPIRYQIACKRQLDVTPQFGMVIHSSFFA